MRKRLLKRLLLTGLLFLSHFCFAAEQTINALWNDSHGFGIFIYGHPNTCGHPGYGITPFLEVGNSKQTRSEVKEGTFQVTDIQTCTYLSKAGFVNCEKGTIEFHYVPKSNEYVGKFQVTLTNGKEYSGDFRAQYCLPIKHPR